ncbi:hypothetical protein AYJ56_03645 [Brucella anthropi]|nr:hypothetical protein AYJ56_03645 [Brucella anthropi]
MGEVQAALAARLSMQIMGQAALVEQAGCTGILLMSRAARIRIQRVWRAPMASKGGGVRTPQEGPGQKAAGEAAVALVVSVWP